MNQQQQQQNLHPFIKYKDVVVVSNAASTTTKKKDSVTMLLSMMKSMFTLPPTATATATGNGSATSVAIEKAREQRKLVARIGYHKQSESGELKTRRRLMWKESMTLLTNADSSLNNKQVKCMDVYWSYTEKQKQNHEALDELLSRFYPFIEYDEHVRTFHRIVKNSAVLDGGEEELEKMITALIMNSKVDANSDYFILSRFGRFELLRLFDYEASLCCPMLRDAGIHPFDIADRLKWFENFFSGTLPESNCLLRVIDSFLIEGIKVLMRVGVSILVLLERDVVQFVKSELKSVDDKAIDSICKKIAEICMGGDRTDVVDALMGHAFGLPLKRKRFADIVESSFICSLSMQNAILGNSMVSISGEYQWIGFDVDHTLIEYYNDAVDDIFRNGFVRFVIEEDEDDQLYRRVAGASSGSSSASEDKAAVIASALKMVALSIKSKTFPKNLFSPELGLAVKGAVIDITNGNVIKYSSNGRADRAYHGVEFIPPHEMQNLGYFSKRSIEDDDGGSDKRFATVHTCFERIMSPIFALCVSSIDKEMKERKMDSASTSAVYNLCFNQLQNIFITLQSRFCEYGTYAAFRDPSMVKKLVLKQPEVRNWLKHLRSIKNVRLFIVSNARVSHMYNIMNYAYDKDWTDYFDLIVVGAKKKMKFFEVDKGTGDGSISTSPSYSFRLPTSFEPIDFASELAGSQVPMELIPRRKFVSAGNAALLHERMNDIQPNSAGGGASGRILFFGDNIDQDVIYPKRFGWDTVAVVTEMDSMKQKKQAGALPPSGTPNSNKNDFIPVNNSFVDEIVTNPTLGSPFRCADGSPTHLAHAMMKHAKISIPSLSFIARQALNKNSSASLATSTIDHALSYFGYQEVNDVIAQHHPSRLRLPLDP